MLNRRKFLAASAAATVLGVARSSAHQLGEAYELPEAFLPREVRIRAEFEAGMVLVDPNQFALYVTMEDQRAMRYTVGIGRGNLYHPGEFYVGRKAEWPRWRPSPDMLARDPEHYSAFQEGGEYAEGSQPGGVNNPLGARAMYLYNVSTRRDTYLRLHGTNNPRTIGKEVSNGCARLINPHVEMLYEQVPVGTRVVLYPKAGAGPAHSEV